MVGFSSHVALLLPLPLALPQLFKVAHVREKEKIGESGDEDSSLSEALNYQLIMTQQKHTRNIPPRACSVV